MQAQDDEWERLSVAVTDTAERLMKCGHSKRAVGYCLLSLGHTLVEISDGSGAAVRACVGMTMLDDDRKKEMH